MSYDLRDFLFDLCKESTKQSQQRQIRQQCENMRHRVCLLPEENHRMALLDINEYEYNQIQSFNIFVSNVWVVKEILKMLRI